METFSFGHAPNYMNTLCNGPVGSQCEKGHQPNFCIVTTNDENLVRREKFCKRSGALYTSEAIEVCR